MMASSPSARQSSPDTHRLQGCKGSHDHSSDTNNHDSKVNNPLQPETVFGKVLMPANPFSVKIDNLQSDGILAKPKFSLKPSSIGAVSKEDVETKSDPHANTILPPSNSFLRPPLLKFDDESASNPLAKSNDASDNNSHKKEATSSAQGHDTAADSASRNPPATSTNSLETNQFPADASTHGSAGDNRPTSLAGSSENVAFGNRLTNNVLPSRSQSGFVFGEQIEERVTNAIKENGSADHNELDKEKPKTKTLEEASEEYKKQQESGPILPEVETFTGEENESNVLQIGCKLFLFDKVDGSWLERGRGILRLNDGRDNKHSRIVMRTSGILKVILNTNIWPAMLCDRANQKSLRITGMEGDQVHIYLLTGSASDIEHLYSAVTYRLQRLKQQVAMTEESSTLEYKRRASPDTQISPKKSRLHSDDSPSAE